VLCLVKTKNKKQSVLTKKKGVARGLLGYIYPEGAGVLPNWFVSNLKLILKSNVQYSTSNITLHFIPH
jgi:hypothetical protein